MEIDRKIAEGSTCSSPDQRTDLEHVVTETGWMPLELGEMTTAPQCWCRDGTEWLEFDTSRIRNLLPRLGAIPIVTCSSYSGQQHQKVSDAQAA